MEPLSEDLSNYAVPAELEEMLKSFECREAPYFEDDVYQEILQS